MRHFSFYIVLFLAALLTADPLFFMPTAQALLKKGGEKDSATYYYDVYLTTGDVCRHCLTERVDSEHLRLSNAQGAWTIVPFGIFMGIDYHPVARKLLIKSLHGINKSGPELVPYAFDNVNDYVCRYCLRAEF
jgi:hypothetical protein